MTRPGRGGEPADHPVQKLPLPPPGAGGGQRPVPQHHVPPVGEMDYTDQEALYPGGPSRKEGADGVAGLHQDPALTQDKQNRAQLEARFVAREIARLLREVPRLRRPRGTRPLQPEDVAILLRSPGRCAATTPGPGGGRGGLVRRGGGDLFATTEVSVALSWLQIIDNPLPRTSPCWRFSAPPWWG